MRIVRFLFLAVGMVVSAGCPFRPEEFPGLPSEMRGVTTEEFVHGLSCTHWDDGGDLTGQALEDARTLLLELLHTPPDPEIDGFDFGPYCIAPDYCLCYAREGTVWFVVQVYASYVLVSQRPNVVYAHPTGSEQVPGLRRVQMTPDLEARLDRIHRAANDADSPGGPKEEGRKTPTGVEPAT